MRINLSKRMRIYYTFIFIHYLVSISILLWLLDVIYMTWVSSNTWIPKIMKMGEEKTKWEEDFEAI